MKKQIAIIVSGVFATTIAMAATENENPYSDSIKDALPLSPEKVKQFREDARAVDKAETERAAPLNPRIRDIVVYAGNKNIDKIYMAQGMATYLSFSDAEGNPLNVVLPGALIGDKNSINASAIANKVTLDVKKPWRATNLQVPIEGISDFIPFTITSERDPLASEAVDYQVRVRVVTGSRKIGDKKDRYDMNSLMGMVNGIKIGNMTPLQIASTEVKDANQNWMSSQNNFASFNLGNDGLTYLVLDPGYKLVKNNDVLASQQGSDGSAGYIIGGNNPRIFNVIQSQSGAWFKITLNR